MRILWSATVLFAMAATACAQESPHRPLDLSKWRVVLSDHDWQQPIHAKLDASRTASASEASFFANFQLPYARLEPVKVHVRGSGDVSVKPSFWCLGEEDPERSFLVELRALDNADRLVHHTWVLESDPRIHNNATQVGARLIPQNTPHLQIPAKVAPEVATLEIMFREMSPPQLEHFPRAPHKMKLAMTRPDEHGKLEFVFTNPIGWDLDPATHEIAFQVFLKDDTGRTVDRSAQFLPYRADGQYKVKATIPPALFPHSSVSATVYTRQGDNETFRQKFFVEGRGSQYKGAWTADAGKLSELPFVDSAYR